jgi:hypothetical protein
MMIAMSLKYAILAVKLADPVPLMNAAPKVVEEEHSALITLTV